MDVLVTREWRPRVPEESTGPGRRRRGEAPAILMDKLWPRQQLHRTAKVPVAVTGGQNLEGMDNNIVKCSSGYLS